jgi:hypothetical protein
MKIMHETKILVTSPTLFLKTEVGSSYLRNDGSAGHIHMV